MTRIIGLLAIVVLIGVGVLGAQQPPAAVSTYDGVMNVVNAAAAAAPTLVHVSTLGTSVEKRAIPLVVIVPDVADGSAAAVRASSKLRVWVRAGVHGSDADGVEAVLAVVRDLAAGKHSEWFGSVALLITPLINPDGHERVSVEHLGSRNGPARGVGQRVNAANVNIDHDYVRLDSPEARAMVDFIAAYDPQVAIDLRGADNACGAHAIAYGVPLHPNISERVASLARNDWAPFVTRNLKSKYSINAGPDGRLDGPNGLCGLPGEAPPAPSPSAAGRRGGAGPAGAAATARGRSTGRAAPAAPPVPVEVALPVWSSAPDAPRTFASYVGLRNRAALTGSSDGYAPFEDRVNASTHFLEEAVAFTYAASARFEKAVEATDADLVVGSSLATSWRPITSGKVDVLTGAVQPIVGSAAYARVGSTSLVTMTDRVGQQPDTTETMAAEYYIPEGLTSVVDLLRRHGIQLRQLTLSTRAVEQFTITGAPASSIVDGHATKTLTGAWQAAGGVVVPAGSWVVRMNQRLARLAFSLIEPTSNDGMATWNVLDSPSTGAYPILRKR